MRVKQIVLDVICMLIIILTVVVSAENMVEFISPIYNYGLYKLNNVVSEGD